MRTSSTKISLTTTLLVLGLLLSPIQASISIKSSINRDDYAVIAYQYPEVDSNIIFERVSTDSTVEDFKRRVNVEPNASNPGVAEIKDGSFVVTFESEGNIYAQVYDFDGQELDDQIKVNPDDGVAYSHPSVAALYEGHRFVVVYQDDSDIYFTGFQADGVVRMDHTKVNDLTEDIQRNPMVVTNDLDDDFMVVWEGYDPDQEKWYLYGKTYWRDFDNYSDNFRLSTEISGDQSNWAVTGSMHSYDFAVAWLSIEGDIFVIVFNYDGTEYYEEIVNEETITDITSIKGLTAKYDYEDQIVVTWEQELDGGESSIQTCLLYWDTTILEEQNTIKTFDSDFQALDIVIFHSHTHWFAVGQDETLTLFNVYGSEEFTFDMGIVNSEVSVDIVQAIYDESLIQEEDHSDWYDWYEEDYDSYYHDSDSSN